jgi:hypothetical protein
MNFTHKRGNLQESSGDICELFSVRDDVERRGGGNISTVFSLNQMAAEGCKPED